MMGCHAGASAQEERGKPRSSQAGLAAEEDTTIKLWVDEDAKTV